MGFTGAIVDDLAFWMENRTKELKTETICIPFLGSAKSLSLWGRDKNMHIESWDTQYIVSLVVNSIFNAKKPKFNIKEPQHHW